MRIFSDPSLLMPQSITDTMCWSDYKHAYQLLELEQPSAHIVTITGTNGKSSTAQIIADLACQDSLNVVCFTSPHLFDFRERLQLNQSWIGDQQWNLAARCVIDKLADIKLTLFAWITLIALFIICRHELDLVILEVGMGGRLDPVNIWDADCAVLTNLSLEHTGMLGRTLSEIAHEKLGILRDNQHVVVASDDWYRYIQFENHEKLAIHNSLLCYTGNNQYRYGCHTMTLKSDLFTGFWTNSLATAWVVSRVVYQSKRTEYAPTIPLKGRHEWLTDSICADVSHNLAAIELFIEYMIHHSRQLDLPLRVYFSCLARKSYCEMIPWLLSQPLELVVTGDNDSESITEEAITSFGATWEELRVVSNYLTTADHQDKLIAVCGGFSFTGNVLRLFGKGN
ncbi:MAG: hypothetical protein CMF46_04145 [Legionellales bacterium]|nr:hypothetical protein [Legionellales bacterium]